MQIINMQSIQRYVFYFSGTFVSLDYCQHCLICFPTENFPWLLMVIIIIGSYLKRIVTIFTHLFSCLASLIHENLRWLMVNFSSCVFRLFLLQPLYIPNLCEYSYIWSKKIPRPNFFDWRWLRDKLVAHINMQ